MKLEDLLKLPISELTKLPLEKFEELSLDERIQFIEDKERKLENYRRSGPSDFSRFLETIDENANLNKLAKFICPELIEKREEEAFKADFNRRMEKIEARRKKLGINPRDIIHDWELEDLSKRQQIILNEFQQMNILTEDFRPHDLLEIFQCTDRMRYSYYESASAYCAEDALADTLNEIKKEYPSLKSDYRFDKIFIICLSPNFEDIEYILEKGTKIIKNKYGANPDVLTYIAVAIDGDLRGSCDLAIRLIMC